MNDKKRKNRQICALTGQGIIRSVAALTAISAILTIKPIIADAATKSSRNSGPGAVQFVSPTGEAAAGDDSTGTAGAAGAGSTDNTGAAGVAGDVTGDASVSAFGGAGTAAAAVETSVKVLENLPEANAGSPILGGAALYMLASKDPANQILSCIIRAADGTVIVVDGGLGDDKDILKAAIRELGGSVSAWLVTHPHGDHAGALYRLLEEEIACRAAGIAPDITIQNIYYNMATPDWYQANDASDGAFSILLLDKFAQLDQSRLHSVSRGTVIMAGSTKIEVINDRYETDWNKGNGASICYKIWVNGKSILFLGDMSSEGGKRLLQYEKDNLKADIVQLAHHGQAGVDEDVYKAIAPSIALWPTPQWLYNQTEDGKYQINATKSWMKKLGAKSYVVLSSGFVLR